jgi:hypothetical protein
VLIKNVDFKKKHNKKIKDYKLGDKLHNWKIPDMNMVD